MLDFLVAGEVRLLLGADGVDVSGLHQRRQADLELSGSLQELEDDEAGALEASLLDDGVEGVDPLLRLGGVDVRQLLLELVEDLVHGPYGSRPAKVGDRRARFPFSRVPVTMTA